MTPELALSITSKENQSISEWLESAKKLFLQNGGEEIRFPYTTSDIQFQKFLELANLSKREKDMIYLAEFFNAAYHILHFKIVKQKMDLSEYDKEILGNVFEKLSRYNLQSCLLNDLTTKKYFQLVKKYASTNVNDQ